MSSSGINGDFTFIVNKIITPPSTEAAGTLYINDSYIFTIIHCISIVMMQVIIGWKPARVESR